MSSSNTATVYLQEVNSTYALKNEFYKSITIFNNYVSPFTESNNRMIFNYTHVILATNPTNTSNVALFSLQYGGAFSQFRDVLNVAALYLTTYLLFNFL